MSFIDLNSEHISNNLFIHHDKKKGKGLFVIYSDHCPYCIELILLVKNNIKFPVYGFNINRNKLNKQFFNIDKNTNGVPLILPVNSKSKILKTKKKLIGLQNKNQLNQYYKNIQS